MMRWFVVEMEREGKCLVNHKIVGVGYIIIGSL